MMTPGCVGPLQQRPETKSTSFGASVLCDATLHISHSQYPIFFSSCPCSHLPLGYQFPNFTSSVSPKIFLSFSDNDTLHSTFISLALKDKDRCTSCSWSSFSFPFLVPSKQGTWSSVFHNVWVLSGRQATGFDIFANKTVSGFTLSDISALVVRKQDNQKIIILPIYIHKTSCCLISIIFSSYTF